MTPNPPCDKTNVLQTQFCRRTSQQLSVRLWWPQWASQTGPSRTTLQKCWTSRTAESIRFDFPTRSSCSNKRTCFCLGTQIRRFINLQSSWSRLTHSSSTATSCGRRVKALTLNAILGSTNISLLTSTMRRALSWTSLGPSIKFLP